MEAAVANAHSICRSDTWRIARYVSARAMKKVAVRRQDSGIATEGWTMTVESGMEDET